MSLAFTATIVLFLGLAAIGLPVAFAMLTAAAAYFFIAGRDPGLASELILNGLYNSFVLIAVPLFILAAAFMNAGTVTDKLLAFCLAIVGRLRGGLGHVNVMASLVFSGMSGSAIADAAGIGRIIIDMMRGKGGYPPGYAAAITAASATIGPIIPPSIPMVLYALISGTSVGYLFLAGIIPGLIMAGVLMALNAWIAWRRNFPRHEAVPLRRMPAVTVAALPALLMPVILLSGIYGGATTPTEAAAIAAAYALLLAFLVYRALTIRAFIDILVEAARSTGIVSLIIAGALVFNYIVASENIPALVSRHLADIDMSPLAFLLMVNVIILLLGCLLDATTLILIVIPLFLPTMRMLGIDPVHFGVVAIINTMIGLITPPYGVLLFVINGLTGIPLTAIIREIWPFLGILLLALLALITLPDLVLWLPRQFGYGG